MKEEQKVSLNLPLDIWQVCREIVYVNLCFMVTLLGPKAAAVAQ